MAIKRRRQNPESAMLQSEADDAIITSGAVMDEVYAEYAEIDHDLSVLAKIEAKILAKGDGKELSKEARARRRALKERLRQLDRLIAAYTNRVIKQAKSRLKEVKASPLAKLHKRNISTVERDIFKLENMVKRKGSDVRLMANSLIGGLVTLEDSMGIKATMGSRALSKKDRERENIRKLFLATYVRWDQVKKHARNHDKFFIRGSEVFSKKYGSGIVIDNDGRKMTVKFEGIPYKEMTKASLTPGPVMWVDAQIDAIKNKFKKGRAIEKSDIQRIVAKIVKIHNHTKPRGKLKTYKESNRALEALIGKIETRLSGDKMDKATVESFLLELEDFHNRVPARMKSEWAKSDQRQWAGDITKVRKALTKLKRKANPCVGFHFHGKDAGELLKAVEESNARQRKGVKENPTAKRARKYGAGAEERKSKSNKERGYRIKRQQRTAAKGRRRMNPRPGMTISKFAHWLGKPEAEVDTQKQKLEYLNQAAEWEDYGVVTPTELRDAQAIVRAQNPGKRKSNPDDIWSDEITRAQATALKAWKKQHPEADVEHLRALLKWHDQHYEATPKHATMAASRIGYTLGRSGSGIPTWFPRLGAILHDHAKEERKSGLRDSGRSPNPKGRAKKKAAKKNPKKDGGNDVSMGMSFNGWDIDSISIKYGVPELMLLSKDVGGEKYTLRVMYQLESGGRGKEPVIHSYGGWIYGGGLMDGRYVPSNERQAHWNYRNDLRLITRWANGIVKDKKVNPSKKKPAKKKATKAWSARDIKGMQEFADRKLGTKKKATKKKVARKKTPEWQRLINRCRKLWDHYCERPSKARLKPVLEHLEKMKASTSKKVADERKSCLRIANKEARRLKLK